MFSKSIFILFFFSLILSTLLITLRFTDTKKPISKIPSIQTTAPQTETKINSIYTNQAIVFHGSTESAKLALTFDADMTPGMLKKLNKGEIKTYYNQEIIKILRENNTPATLFLTGMWIESYPAITKELSADPLFELANHSYSHPGFTNTCFGLPSVIQDQKGAEITKTQELLKKITGKDNIFFRFPGGCYSKDDLMLAKKIGVLPIQWNLDGPDSFNPNENKIINNLKNHTQNGSIITLHLNGNKNAPKTAEVISQYIPWAKSQGYTFVKLSELLK